MANISTITTPDNETYDVKDANAVASVTHSNGTVTVTKRDATSTSFDLPSEQGFATCSTAAATAAKAVTVANYLPSIGSIVTVKFTNEVGASATLTVNSNAAAPIYYHGAAITAGILMAGDIVTFVFDGTNYHVIAVDRWASPSVTVSSSQPSDAGTLIWITP